MCRGRLKVVVVDLCIALRVWVKYKEMLSPVTNCDL